MDDIDIEKIVPNPTKNIKVFVGNSIYLEVTPKNSKRWRFRYKHNKKEKLISLGVYPDVSYKEAYELRCECKAMLLKGIDPSKARKFTKQAYSNLK